MLCAFSMLLLLLMELKEINVELSLMLPKFFASLPTNNKDRKTYNHQPLISDPFYLFVLPSLIKYPP